MNKFNVERVHPTQKNEEKNIFDDGLFEPEIVGGIEVTPRRKYNFFVAIGGCGASLVAPNVLLSAAHCSSINGPATIGIHMREVDSSTEFDEVARIPFDTSTVHPGYNSNTLDNDYWVIKLAYDVPSKFLPHIVALNSDSSFPAKGDEVTVIGLGTTTSGGSIPNAMQEVAVDYITNGDCCATPSLYSCGEITSNMMCAARPGKDSCQGDSGGPIFADKEGITTQVGIVSWGYGCADPTYPGVYSRVSSKYTWIQEKIDVYNSTRIPAPTPADGQKVDEPLFWYDRDGPAYSCSWYAAGNNCRRYGDRFPNAGITANDACVACGGGSGGGSGGCDGKNAACGNCCNECKPNGKCS